MTATMALWSWAILLFAAASTAASPTCGDIMSVFIDGECCGAGPDKSAGVACSAVTQETLDASVATLQQVMQARALSDLAVLPEAVPPHGLTLAGIQKVEGDPAKGYLRPLVDADGVDVNVRDSTYLTWDNRMVWLHFGHIIGHYIGTKNGVLWFFDNDVFEPDTASFNTTTVDDLTDAEHAVTGQLLFVDMYNKLVGGVLTTEYYTEFEFEDLPDDPLHLCHLNRPQGYVSNGADLRVSTGAGSPGIALNKHGLWRIRKTVTPADLDGIEAKQTPHYINENMRDDGVTEHDGAINASALILSLITGGDGAPRTGSTILIEAPMRNLQYLSANAVGNWVAEATHAPYGLLGHVVRKGSFDWYYGDFRTPSSILYPVQITTRFAGPTPGIPVNVTGQFGYVNHATGEHEYFFTRDFVPTRDALPATAQELSELIAGTKAGMPALSSNNTEQGYMLGAKLAINSTVDADHFVRLRADPLSYHRLGKSGRERVPPQLRAHPSVREYVASLATRVAALEAASG